MTRDKINFDIMTEKPTDTREWYKKKRFIIPGVIIFLIIIANLGDDKEKTNETKNNVTERTDTIDFKTNLKNNIKSLNGDNFKFDDYNDPTSFVMFAGLYKAYGQTIVKGKQSTDDSIKLLTKTLEQKVIKSQKKNFPKARLAYQKMLKSKLWENDIEVSISGTGNTTLNFVGGVYAANKNIKETQEAIHEMLTYLRFKQTTYRWYKGAEEYQYYTIESDKDGTVKD